jgi:hypothetical protein
MDEADKWREVDLALAVGASVIGFIISREDDATRP